MKVSKGMGVHVAALHVPAPGENQKEAARVFYVAAALATQRLRFGWVGLGIGRALDRLSLAQCLSEATRANSKRNVVQRFGKKGKENES